MEQPEYHAWRKTFIAERGRPPTAYEAWSASRPAPATATVGDAFERECDDADAILRHLGLDPEQCRTDGGSLNVPRIKTLLGEAIASRPTAADVPAVEQTSPLAAHTDLLTYVLQGDVHNRLTPRVIDIAYTAFMQAKRPNEEDGGSSDWFNDTKPVVEKAIDKLRKDLFADRATPPAKAPAQEHEAARHVKDGADLESPLNEALAEVRRIAQWADVSLTPTYHNELRRAGEKRAFNKADAQRAAKSAQAALERTFDLIAAPASQAVTSRHQSGDGEALSDLAAALEFTDKARAAAKQGEDVTSTGAWRDAREWLESAARKVCAARQQGGQ